MDTGFSFAFLVSTGTDALGIDH
uniref:Uncharacterized protein n=1 Tax=Anguilla anguilla TaxID=7936 RepID=A0A0E9XV62_ANGAN